MSSDLSEYKLQIENLKQENNILRQKLSSETELRKDWQSKATEEYELRIIAQNSLQLKSEELKKQQFSRYNKTLYDEVYLKKLEEQYLIARKLLQFWLNYAYEINCNYGCNNETDIKIIETETWLNKK